MYTIDRAVAIVSPNQPFVDWINSNPDSAGEFVSLEKVRQDATAYLIPEFETSSDLQATLRELAQDIFAIELEAWSRNVQTWPRNRDYAVFQKWFTVEIHSLVLDPFENEIFKDDF
jgi:hypothetical protein